VALRKIWPRHDPIASIQCSLSMPAWSTFYYPAPCGFTVFIVCKASSPATEAAACWAVTSAIYLVCVGVPPLFDVKKQATRLVGASLSVDMGLLFECKPCGTMLWHVLRRRRALSDTDQQCMAPSIVLSHHTCTRSDHLQPPLLWAAVCSARL
jgi:hypothetical protein